MKKSLLALFLATLVTAPVLAEPLARIESEDGNINIVGFTTETKDNQNYFIGLFEFENTTEESAAPLYDFQIDAFQDGIELEMKSIPRYEYQDFKNLDTKVRPGSTLRFYKIFAITSQSPVDVEIGNGYGDKAVNAEYTFDLNAEILPEFTEESEDTQTQTPFEMLQELQRRVDNLERRISDLEKN